MLSLLLSSLLILLSSAVKVELTSEIHVSLMITSDCFFQEKSRAQILWIKFTIFKKSCVHYTNHFCQDQSINTLITFFTVQILNFLLIRFAKAYLPISQLWPPLFFKLREVSSNHSRKSFLAFFFRGLWLRKKGSIFSALILSFSLSSSVMHCFNESTCLRNILLIFK